MQEQQAITLLQQAIDLLTKATVILQNNSNRDQQKLPKKADEQNPSPPRECSVKGCRVELTNPTHTLCYQHFLEKMQRDKEIQEA